MLGSGGCPIAFALDLSPAPVTTFPAPASSNAACGFPALRFPVAFNPRFMGPVEPGALSAADGEPGTVRTIRAAHRATAYSTSSSQILVSLRREIYSPPQVLQTYGRLCHLVPAFLVVRETSTAGRLRSAGVTPPQRYYTPIRHPLAFGPLPGVAGYRTYLAPAISRRGEEGFSSCSVCPCHRAAAITPPKWTGRLNQLSTVHAAFALRL